LSKYDTPCRILYVHSNPWMLSFESTRTPNHQRRRCRLRSSILSAKCETQAVLRKKYLYARSTTLCYSGGSRVVLSGLKLKFLRLPTDAIQPQYTDQQKTRITGLSNPTPEASMTTTRQRWQGLMQNRFQIFKYRTNLEPLQYQKPRHVLLRVTSRLAAMPPPTPPRIPLQVESPSKLTAWTSRLMVWQEADILPSISSSNTAWKWKLRQISNEFRKSVSGSNQTSFHRTTPRYYHWWYKSSSRSLSTNRDTQLARRDKGMQSS
jgi:hypothetical protein